MRGRLRDLSDNGAGKLLIPVEVRTIRTFHGTDGRYHRLSNTDYHARTLDREIRIPMPLIRYGRENCKMLKEIAI